MALKRINLNLDEELLKHLDVYANQMHITRSAAISVLLSQLFQGQQTIETMNKLLFAYNEEKANTGKVATTVAGNGAGGEGEA